MGQHHVASVFPSLSSSAGDEDRSSAAFELGVGLAWVDASEIVADVVGDEDQLRAADTAAEEETWRFDDGTVGPSFAVEAATMLAAGEEVAILFEQEVATAG